MHLHEAVHVLEVDMLRYTWLVLISLVAARSAWRRASHHGGAERDSQGATTNKRSENSLFTHHLENNKQ